MRMRASRESILLEPAAIPRPLTQQRLMRELDLTIADGQQASIGQLRQNRTRTLDALKLVQRHPPAGERPALAACEPQHHTPRDLPLALAESGVGVFGQAGNRAPHTTARSVAAI